MLIKETLHAMRRDLLGKKIDYCFHLHTPSEARRSFRILRIDSAEEGWFSLVGEERSIQSNGAYAFGYLREGDHWIKEGSVYRWMGEEPRIDGQVWGQWFMTGPTVRMPKGI